MITASLTGFTVTCGVCSDNVVDEDSEAVTVFDTATEAIEVATADDWTIAPSDPLQAVCPGDGRYHHTAREYVAAGFTIAQAYQAAGYSPARAVAPDVAGIRQHSYVRLGCDMCRTPLIRFHEIDDENGALFGSIAEAIGVAKSAASPHTEPWWTIRPDGYATCPADNPVHDHSRTCPGPMRHRRSRTAKSSLPPGTVVVTRGTRFGNRNRIGESGIADAAAAVEAFRADVAADPALITAIRVLRGRCIACWCGPDGPCHGDVILQIANTPLSEHDASVLADLEAAAAQSGIPAAARAHAGRLADPWLAVLAADPAELAVLLKQWRTQPVLTADGTFTPVYIPTTEGQTP